MARQARTVPTVTVKSRHTEGCKFFGLPKSKKPGLKTSCNCPKQLAWCENGSEKRKSAETCDGDVARTKAREMEAEFERLSHLTPEQAAAEVKAKTITEAITDYCQSVRIECKTDKHVDRLHRELTEMAAWLSEKNITDVPSATLALLEQFRNSWTGEISTRRKRQSRMSGFWSWCAERKFCPSSPMQGLRLPKQPKKNKEPRALTDEQFAHLLAAIPSLNHGTTNETRNKLRGIMLLQRWTGLAIRDAVLVERQKVIAAGKSEAVVMREKTGNEAHIILQSEMALEIISLGNQDGRYLFVEERPEDERERDTLVALWASRARRVGELAGLDFSSHDLRHTFVRWALKRIHYKKVARMIGDSVKVMLEFYCRWIEEDSEELIGDMQKAWQS